MIMFNGIDYSQYFNHPVELKRYNESNSEYSPDGEYGPAEIILAWVGGPEKLIRETDNQSVVASKSYRSLTPIKVKDIIDGQVVINSYIKYGLDGVTVEFYKAYVE